MVDKFKKILDEIVTTNGPVSFFAVMKMDDLTDKWTVILSAPWADDAHSQNAFGVVFGLLPKYFSDEERSTIARIGIFNKSEHLISLLLQYKKDSVIENEKVNGNFVHQAYILESNSTV